MFAWLIPVCLFGLFGSIFLGGTTIEPQGGTGLRQMLGLLASCAVHVALWNGLALTLGAMMPALAAMVFASLLAIPGVLLASWIGFMIFGVKLGRTAPAH
ncbi:MAG: hypothetical protein ACRENP_24830 [Longimicrobiales bacterium]